MVLSEIHAVGNTSGSSAPPFRAEHPLRGLFAHIRLLKLQARSSVVEVELP
jgi:hypothetical protein